MKKTLKKIGTYILKGLFYLFWFFISILCTLLTAISVIIGATMAIVGCLVDNNKTTITGLTIFQHCYAFRGDLFTYIILSYEKAFKEVAPKRFIVGIAKIEDNIEEIETSIDKIKEYLN